MEKIDLPEEPEATRGAPGDDNLLLDKRGFTWGLLVFLLVATMIGAIVLAYFITRHNFPAH